MHLLSVNAALDTLVFRFSQLVSFFRVKILKIATFQRTVLYYLKYSYLVSSLYRTEWAEHITQRTGKYINSCDREDSRKITCEILA
jgi:hypothetical protein